MRGQAGAARGDGELILVVDDDRKIADLVRAYLERAGYSVAVAEDGLTALRMIRDQDPALVVLDLMLPELDGRTVARAAREESECAIIMLTALGSTQQRVLGLEAGADDYLAKPFAPAELVARVRSVLRRRRPRQPAGVLQHEDLLIDCGRRTVRRGERPIELTAAEFDLVAALAAARGRVLSRVQLLQATLRGNTDAQERSVDVHVRRLRAKLGDDARRPSLIVTVRGLGYRLGPA